MYHMFYVTVKYYNIVTEKSMQTKEISHIFHNKKPHKCCYFNIYGGFPIFSSNDYIALFSDYFVVRFSRPVPRLKNGEVIPLTP